jgi:O-acetyl-ADP-ribose deacetylase (regulator of RNase III)
MFIPPELWRGEPATPRTDLYSAAATLHLLWQREAPFVAGELAELARMHKEEPYRVPACTDPIAAYFGTLLARLMTKDPAARPESAAGTARMLERIATPPPELRRHTDETAHVGDVLVQLEERDLCAAKTDVIVCAAKESLEMRSGVAGALAHVAGEELEREAMAQAPINMGQVVWTGPGKLHCKEVAHAAAAVDGAVCVQRAVLRTLFEAERRGHHSITFPALGTGKGDVPHGLGARLVLEAIRTFAAFEPRHCRTIRIALVTPEAMNAWRTGLVAFDAGLR